MNWIINFLLFIVLWLFGMDIALNWQLLHYNISDIKFKIAYQSRYHYMKNYITAITNYKTVKYKDSAKVWDVANAKWIDIKGLQFDFKFTDQDTWYLLVPNTGDDKEYIFSWYATKLEHINKYFIDIARAPIWSYYYSWNNNTWYVYNAIDNSKVCYFDSSKNNCK